MTRFFASDSRASAFRAVVRSTIALSVAFGLKLSAEQVAAVVAGVESVIQFGRVWYTKDI